MDWKNPLSSKNGDDFVYLPDTLEIISKFKQSGLQPDEIRQIIADNQRVIDVVKDEIQQIFACLYRSRKQYGGQASKLGTSH